MWAYVESNTSTFHFACLYLKFHWLFQCEGVPEAQKLIEQLLQLIPPMRATINLGIQPEAKDCTKNGRFINQQSLIACSFEYLWTRENMKDSM